MAQVVNTNVASLNAQRNLNRSQSEVGVSLERLSSGLRINSAKDDAAGLAISTRATAQINGFNQAARNAGDAISLAQTAEGALGEIVNNLQRVRELAVQSANSTNSASDRASLDAEVQQRIEEITRVAQQTSFNGQKILNGSFGTAQFQVGANVGEQITVSLNQNNSATDIGRTADYVGAATQFSTTAALGTQGAGVDGNAIAGGNVTVALGTGSAVSVGASTAGAGSGQTADSAYAKAAAIEAAGIGGLTVKADTTAEIAFTTVGNAATAFALDINGTAIFSSFDPTADIAGDEIASRINANTAATGVTASFDSVGNTFTLNAADGRNIAISQTRTAGAGGFAATSAAPANNTANDALTVGNTGTTETFRGSVRLSAAENITLGGSALATIGYNGATSLSLGNSALNSADVTTVAEAETTITRVDAALSSINSLQGTLGAVQNRFESVIASLQSSAENASATRSRILDADFAAETAALTRGQILQQAGISILSQANQAPQSVLSLLQ